MGGLGAEVVKNLTLAGISVTVVDDAVVTAHDLSANFFLAESDIGANRALASLPRIRELNKYVTIEGRTEALDLLSDDVVATHNVVIVTGPRSTQRVGLNAFCRKHGIAFYSADVFGFEGFLFVDVGSHTYRTESGSGEKKKLSGPIVTTFPSLREAIEVPLRQLGSKRFGPVSPVYVHARILSEFNTAHDGRAATAGDAHKVLGVGQRLFAREEQGSQFRIDDARQLAACAQVGNRSDCNIHREHRYFSSGLISTFLFAFLFVVVVGSLQANLAPVCALLGGVLGRGGEISIRQGVGEIGFLPIYEHWSDRLPPIYAPFHTGSRYRIVSF